MDGRNMEEIWRRRPRRTAPVAARRPLEAHPARGRTRPNATPATLTSGWGGATPRSVESFEPRLDARAA